MNKTVLFSSTKADWSTPQDFFDQLNQEFNFDLDAAADEKNHKCHYWLGPGSRYPDALSETWGKGHHVWLNPPYGREIGKWVEKAYEESTKGTLVVMLLPARTDTKWFHDYCVMGELRFYRGRLRFEGAPASAPFPSMVVIFRPPSITEPYDWIELR